MITQQQKAEIRLVCPECRHENEAERIYCHECGARLERSALAKAKPKDEDPRETHRRLKQMFDPQGAKLRQRFFLISKAVLGALAVAAVVQMLRPPDVPPVPAQSASAISPSINLDLENAVMERQTNALQYSEEQVNAFLAQVLKSKQASLAKYTLKFDRLVVTLDEGLCRVTAQRSLYGFPLYTTAIYNVALQDGKLVMQNRGGRIGRMPIHPEAMRYGDILFADVRKALERERKTLVKLGAIELHKKQVVFLPKQAQAQAPAPAAQAPAPGAN